MDTDEKIRIALNLVDKATEKMTKGSREPRKDLENLSTELTNTIEYLRIKGFKAVLKLSNCLSTFPALRSRPQKSYRVINEVLRDSFDERSVDVSDVVDILGYARWMLVYKAATTKTGGFRAPTKIGKRYQ